MTGPESFFEWLERDLEQVRRLLEAAGDALVERIEEGNRALLPPNPGNPGNPGNPDPGNPEDRPRRRGYARRVDWDEALGLYEQGWSNAQIAERSA